MSGITRRESTALIGSALLSSTFPVLAQPAQPPIKIGFSMALSGGLAGGGKAALLTYQIWAEEMNAKGGLLGRKVELVYYDDQSSPATVPAIYSKLLDIDKVDLVISGYATVPTAAAMPTVIQHKKLFLSLFALALNDQFKYDRYFQLQPNGPVAKTEISRGFYEVASAMNSKADDNRSHRRRCGILAARVGRGPRKCQEIRDQDRLRSHLSVEYRRLCFHHAADQGREPGSHLLGLIPA